MASSIGSLLEAAQRLERQNDSYFDALRVSTLEILQTLKENHTMYMKNKENAQSQQNVMASQIEQLHSELNRLIAIGEPLEARSQKCIHIMESLQYKRMTARYEKIVKAHAKTFEWIYDESTLSQHGEPQHHLLQWLESGDGLFWVSGKAGSGKSTLMKFITEHPKTRQALSQWASGQHLITAGFYFWHAGTVLQKSQEGLLQSLLYEIFRQCPALIPDVLPERWKSCKPSNPINRHWSRAELIKTFAKLSNEPIMLKRVCFFIDGLDEYDGDHNELIHLLRSFSQPNNIKICASSRPWNVFKRAFGTGSHTMLRLEDLTRNDITLYVRGTLEQSDLFSQLRKSENAHCIDLVNEVVSKAQGVFLWVFLVVRSLLTGLTNADSIMDLRRRLRHLPTDLEAYFAHMLASIDTFYQKQTAQTFQIALDALEPQTIVTYDILDELHEDPQFSLHLSVGEWHRSEMKSQIENTVLRINARGMGLLEVVRGKALDSPWCDRVEFLHRTARDFFRLRAQEDWIAHRLPLSFNTYRLLCGALLAQVKIMCVNRGKSTEELFGLVDEMLGYAYHLEIDLATSPTILLDNLSHTISQHMEGYGSSILDNYEPSTTRILDWRKPFLCLAVHKNLKLYVAEKLDSRSCSNSREDAYLICSALQPCNRAMLCLLLEKGVCITQADNGWGVLFSEIADRWAEASDEEKILQLETISRLLLARENPREVIGTTSWRQFTHMLFGKTWVYGSVEMQRTLMKTLPSLLKTASDSDSAELMEILWCDYMLDVFYAIGELSIGPGPKDIILETIGIFLQHGARLCEIQSSHSATLLPNYGEGRVSEQPSHLWEVILALCRDSFFSTEQKSRLRAMFPSDHINHLNLPHRLHSLGQTLDNPGKSSKRSAPDPDPEQTGSPDRRSFKRRFKFDTGPLICGPRFIAAWFPISMNSPSFRMCTTSHNTSEEGQTNSAPFYEIRSPNELRWFRS